jgi:hypothetical protein
LNNSLAQCPLVAVTCSPVALQAGTGLIINFNREWRFLCVTAVSRAGKSMVGLSVHRPSQISTYNAGDSLRDGFRPFTLGHITFPIIHYRLPIHL